MGLRTYRATGVFLRSMESVLGINIRITGAENLIDRPTLFVVNHFTRFETMIIPYATYRCTRKQVRSLADHKLFQGVMGKYLKSCGVMSVREPLRNRAIIGDLMTGRFGWVIYPEGLMLKNKKMVHKGKLVLDNPERKGRPHTGAAVMALKTELHKAEYLRAWNREDAATVASLRERFGIESPDELSALGTVVVPVNITYYPLRPDQNMVSRMAKLLKPGLTGRFEEELQVEGKILLDDTDMSVHFCPPIQVADYLDRPTHWARRVAGLFSKRWNTELGLRTQAQRLTDTAMRAIYTNVEVNLDHLFCSGLRALHGRTIPVEKFHRAIHLTALELRRRDDVRLHPHLVSGLLPLVTNGVTEQLESIAALASRAGVISKGNGTYHVHRDVLEQDVPFHNVRVANTVQVIANEAEPIPHVVSAIRRNVNLADHELRDRVACAVWQADRDVFHRDYHRARELSDRSSDAVGEPFFLRAKGAQLGIVLTHGYLAAPEEIRQLAEFLHDCGYSVYGVRLEGHGTAPGAMRDATWQGWARSVARGYAAVRHDCKKVVLGGFSLGGVLSLYLASMHKHRVQGVFSINGPVRLRDRRMGMVPAVVLWNRLLDTARISKGQWRSVSNCQTENPGINYELNYVRGINQVRLAIAGCMKRLGEVKAPALIIQADRDPIVRPESGRTLYERLGSERKYLTEMSFDRHVIVRGDGSEKVFEAVRDFVQSMADPARPRIVRGSGKL